MTKAWTPEWVEEQAKLCLDDEEFQTKIAKFNRKVLVLIHPSPGVGVNDEYVYGFDFPSMKGLTKGPDGEWETDYILEGDYESWYRVNERIDPLVPALMDEKIDVPKGSVSYVARFLPGIERYMVLAKSHTTEYDGELKPT
jgi:hypothetical protein